MTVIIQDKVAVATGLTALIIVATAACGVERQPSSSLTADGVVKSLEQSGVQFKRPPEKLLVQMGGASTCLGGVTASALVVTICEYPSETIALEDQSSATGAFKVTANRQVYRNGRVMIGVLPHLAGGEGEAELDRMVKRFETL